MIKKSKVQKSKSVKKKNIKTSDELWNTIEKLY